MAAGFLGAFFVMFAYACYSERVGADAERAAKNLFAYSVLYLFLLFAAMGVDRAVPWGRAERAVPFQLDRAEEPLMVPMPGH